MLHCARHARTSTERANGTSREIQGPRTQSPPSSDRPRTRVGRARSAAGGRDALRDGAPHRCVATRELSSPTRSVNLSTRGRRKDAGETPDCTAHKTHGMLNHKKTPRGVEGQQHEHNHHVAHRIDEPQSTPAAPPTRPSVQCPTRCQDFARKRWGWPTWCAKGA
jgi:hypothetical protein